MSAAPDSRVQPVVEVVVTQHLEDAAILHTTRTTLAEAPHVKLRHLRRFDDRLAAHLDGLLVAGESAWSWCEAALERPSPGALFTAMMHSLADRRADRLDRLLALSEAVPEIRPGLFSALGWLEADGLRGIVAQWLGSPDTAKRLAGIAACGLHRVDPGLTMASRLEDATPIVRARAWRTAGELGKCEWLSAAAAVVDEDPACRFWAAWSAVLLGGRHGGLQGLAATALSPGPFRRRAFQLAIQAMNAQAAQAWLSGMATDAAHLRWVISGAGLVGDPSYIPWLIGHMAEDRTARLAGEAFSLLTGTDLALLDLERKPPESFESAPNDDPEDSNVDLDEDDGLPWPDPNRVQSWWNAHAQQFPSGTRYFMGEPLNRNNCLRVLKEGYQRQRIAAALYLSLLNPGVPLFEWRAPAWRQQRLLAQMT